MMLKARYLKKYFVFAFAFLAGVSSLCSVAQNLSGKPDAACGPANVRFDTEKKRNQKPLPLDAERATVYFISKLSFTTAFYACGAVTRSGIDGQWLGANCGSSWSAFYVSPGPHHLCVNLQSLNPHSSLPLPMLSGLNAEAGRTYFFLMDVLYAPGVLTTSLTQIDPDEGHLLIAEWPLSSSRVKQ